MHKTILTSAVALASTAFASSIGSAIVINACSYDVQLDAVPASGGGQSSSSEVLKAGKSWSQQWTQLTNGAGWSIKLAQSAGASSIMQYEYTYQGDNTIWYDLSEVNGNPWNNDWEITSAGDSSCSPRQAAYRYDTDDAYGEQSCGIESDITVTLCSGESSNDALVSSLAAAATAGTTLSIVQAAAVAAATTSTKAAATTSTTQPTTTAAATHTTTTAAAAAAAETTHSGNGPLHYESAHFANNEKVNTATTLTTAVAATTTRAVVAAEGDDGDFVTVYETVVETATAYETYVPGKRHVHHPEHPHFR